MASWISSKKASSSSIILVVTTSTLQQVQSQSCVYEPARTRCSAKQLVGQQEGVLVPCHPRGHRIHPAASQALSIAVQSVLHLLCRTMPIVQLLCHAATVQRHSCTKQLSSCVMLVPQQVAGPTNRFGGAGTEQQLVPLLAQLQRLLRLLVRQLRADLPGLVHLHARPSFTKAVAELVEGRGQAS